MHPKKNPLALALGLVAFPCAQASEPVELPPVPISVTLPDEPPPTRPLVEIWMPLLLLPDPPPPPVPVSVMSPPPVLAIEPP